MDQVQMSAPGRRNSPTDQDVQGDVDLLLSAIHRLVVDCGIDYRKDRALAFMLGPQFDRAADCLDLSEEARQRIREACISRWRGERGMFGGAGI